MSVENDGGSNGCDAATRHALLARAAELEALAAELRRSAGPPPVADPPPIPSAVSTLGTELARRGPGPVRPRAGVAGATLPLTPPPVRCRSPRVWHRRRRVDRRRLRWILDAYSRGSIATLADAAARLDVTPARLSQVIARPGALPRHLARRCRARTREMRRANGRAARVLAPEEVLAARRRHAAGENLTAIAADLGVAPVTVWRAVMRRSYADIKP